MSSKGTPAWPPIAYPMACAEAYRNELREAFERVLDSGRYILADETAAFEAAFAAGLGEGLHAVGVANGTDALEIALRTWGIGPGDLVAVPSHSAVATACAVRRTGAGCLFLDIEPLWHTLDPDALTLALRSSDAPRIKAIIPVHIYGQPCAMPDILAIAREAGVPVLEDCAQAHGATLNGQACGTFGEAAAFSFYPTKNIGALGDAGLLVTGNSRLAEQWRAFREYGWRERYVSDVVGVNSRLDELQAALLRIKLAHFPEELQRRRQLAGHYAERLGNTRWCLPEVRPGGEHAWHLYVIEAGDLATRDALFACMRAAEAGPALHYPKAIHQQPAYAGCSAFPLGLPVTDAFYRQLLTLPCHPFLTEATLDRVVGILQRFSAA